MSTPARAIDEPTAQAGAPFRFADPDVKRRMLIIVNPYATTVSDRLRHLVVYALQGRFEVDAVDTEARGHATELCREAAHEGYDVVVAFGGDGTVNEAANGLLGSPTPLCCLPGRLGERVRQDARHPRRPRRRDRAPAGDGRRLAPAQGRPGRRQRPLLHVRLGPRPRRERRRARRLQPAAEGAPGRLLLHLGGGHARSCAATCCSPPRLEVLAGERRSTASPRSSRTARRSPTSRTARSRSPRARRSTPARSPAACCTARRCCRCPRSPGARSRRARASPATARSRGLGELSELTVRSADGRPLPLQVDGDYLGEVERGALLDRCRDALNVVA